MINNQLTSLFTHAMNVYDLSNNPCKKVKRMGKDAPRSLTFWTVDEYETIRLIDKEGFSQEECGVYMHVARTTVQQIYNNARKKLAEVIVDGCKLKIEGGDYQICSGEEKVCKCGGCDKHRCQF